MSGPTHYYEVRVDAALDDRWAAWFDGIGVTRDGRQTVVGPIRDEAALHAVLAKVRDLGLRLDSVRRVPA